MKERPAGTAFLADAMLGSFARKLRALGFDTEYFREGGDERALAIAKAEGRVLLTADQALAGFASRHGIAALLVEGRSDGGRLRSLASKAAAAGLSLRSGDSRCSVCNGRLSRAQRGTLTSELPARVISSHRTFFRCTRCGKVYWKGTHWKKLRRLGGLLPEQEY
jgi:uncharacterized protein